MCPSQRDSDADAQASEGDAPADVDGGNELVAHFSDTQGWSAIVAALKESTGRPIVYTGIAAASADVSEASTHQWAVYGLPGLALEAAPSAGCLSRATVWRGALAVSSV